jgi:hypothetical protein
MQFLIKRSAIMKDGRSRVWIDGFQGFQSKLFTRICMYWIVYLLCTWNFLFMWQLLQEGEGNLWDQYTRFVSSQYPTLVCCLLIVPFFAWDAIRFSHRFVGPLIRFRRTFRSIKNNEKVDRVELRKGDFLLDMQDEINSMVDSLRSRGAVPPHEEKRRAPAVPTQVG